MSYPGTAVRPVRIVLADANVLYSRVLRDYLLYAADGGLISVTWSAEIYLGANVMHPDLLLSWLVRDRPDGMRAAHHTAVARLQGATDASTVSALRRAGAPATATLMTRLLESTNGG